MRENLKSREEYLYEIVSKAISRVEVKKDENNEYRIVAYKGLSDSNKQSKLNENERHILILDIVKSLIERVSGNKEKVILNCNVLMDKLKEIDSSYAYNFNAQILKFIKSENIESLKKIINTGITLEVRDSNFTNIFKSFKRVVDVVKEMNTDSKTGRFIDDKALLMLENGVLLDNGKILGGSYHVNPKEMYENIGKWCKDERNIDLMFAYITASMSMNKEELFKAAVTVKDSKYFDDIQKINKKIKKIEYSNLIEDSDFIKTEVVKINSDNINLRFIDYPVNASDVLNHLSRVYRDYIELHGSKYNNEVNIVTLVNKSSVMINYMKEGTDFNKEKFEFLTSSFLNYLEGMFKEYYKDGKAEDSYKRRINNKEFIVSFKKKMEIKDNKNKIEGSLSDIVKRRVGRKI